VLANTLRGRGSATSSAPYRLLGALVFTLATVAMTAAPALATRGHVFASAFGNEGSGNGEFKGPSGVAVNESEGPQKGDVYVVDTGNDRVEWFDSGGTKVEGEFTGSGLLLSEGLNKPPAPLLRPEGIAIDNDPSSPSFGDVYVADVGHGVIDKFSASGEYLGQLAGTCEKPNETPAEGCPGSPSKAVVPFGTIDGVAVDTTGTVWVYQESAEKEVDSYSADVVNAFLSRRAVNVFGPANPGFAVDSLENQSLYVKTFFFGITKLDSSGNEVTHEFDSLIHEPVSAEVPSGVAVDLSSNDVYIDNADGKGSVGRFSSSDSLLERFGMGTLSHGTGLGVNSSTGTIYVADSTADKVDIFPLELPSAPTVQDEWVTDVKADSATLHANVDPRGVSSEYHFEYSPCPSAPTCVAPVPDGQLAADFEIHSVSLHIQGLQPGTAYRYRLVARNELGPGEGEQRTFTTQDSASANTLPDGRAWEMVSPPDKQGAVLQTPFNELGSAMQASANGDAVSYTASAPTEDQPPGNRSPELPQLFSKRSATGWATKVITTPYSEVGKFRAGFGMEYRFFSSDLSLGALLPFAETNLSSEATELTPYLRHDDTCEASPATCYEPLVTASNVAPGVKFAAGNAFVIPIAGTPDLSHLILRSQEVQLLPGGSEELSGLYEWSGGTLQLVSVLPNGEPAPEGGLLGGRRLLRHAISDDGSRVVFTASANGGGGALSLYVRDTVRGKTVQVDAPEPGAQGGIGEALFQAASSDGSRVFFTDAARLTVDSTAKDNTPDLYEFDVEAETLTDLTADHNAGEHAGVQGILQGASEDGSYLYFVANGVLAPKAAPGNCPEPGATCNLYVRHAGVTTFIAALSANDQHWNEETASEGKQELVTSRVSPSGRWFAFMSDRSLTGYDNRDANSGEPDQEVFVYDAASNRLRCASCNPTGARPLGMFESTTSKDVGPLVDRTGIWSHRWLAATVPGWAQVGLGAVVYQTRYLADDGRLFFNSNEALVPRDGNGTMDVYQYEPAKGAETAASDDCSPSSPTFHERSGGCVALISSGGSAEESTFMDASENGNDVFFLTAAQLRPEDFDSELDLYDAQVCSGGSPCLSVPPASPPPCSTGDSCKPAPATQPTIFGPAASATFSGPGNVPAGSTPAVRHRSLTRAQKLAKALKACEKVKKKKKRMACRRLAKKRYAAVKKRSASNKAKK
jgi:hypothetical protein